MSYFNGSSNSSHTMLLEHLFLHSNSVRFAESRLHFLPDIKLSETFHLFYFVYHYQLLLSDVNLPPPWHARLVHISLPSGRCLTTILFVLVTGRIQVFPRLPLHILGTHLCPAFEHVKFQLFSESFSFPPKKATSNFVTFYLMNICCLLFPFGQLCLIYCLPCFKRF